MLSTFCMWIVASLSFFTTHSFDHGICWRHRKYLPLNMKDQGRTTGTFSECQERCYQLSDCAHFSYWPDGGCHVQGSDATPVFARGVVAGPRGACTRTHWDHPKKVAESGTCSDGRGLGVTFTSLQGCFDFCFAMEDCNYVSWEPVGQTGHCIAYRSCNPNKMDHTIPDLTGSDLWQTYAGRNETYTPWPAGGDNGNRRLSAAQAGLEVQV